MQSLWPFLTRELRDAPGRANYTLRLTLSCAVLIVLFMTLHIPFLAVALIVVFYVSQPNVLMIKLVSVVFVVTVSVALGGVLLIIKWTYDYPLIRLVASVILFFCAIYLMRVLGKLGLAFFVVALAVIYAQTFPSMTSQSEILVRLLLWLWVAINTAILVTLLVNACFQQAFPGYQFKARLVVMLRQTARRLSQPDNGTPPPTVTEIAGQFNQLRSLYQQAARATPEIAASPQAWQSLMAAALSCSHLTALLQPGDDHPDARRRIASQLNALADNLPAAAEVQPLIVPRDGANSAILQEIAEVLARLARGETIPLPQGEVEKAPLLLPDAWSNPAYLHFALKTLLATLLCYVFYTAADWQGIHTIMLSCVIVAQPGLGATMQKTWLRIGGALLATLIALLLIVFVQPWTDSLSGLLAMTLPVFALAAWIAAGSERIAYAGIQIGFTFALAFLSWFGPLSNLTELRDRVIGILLGVLVSSIVHLYLWPDSEAPQLKARLAQLYRQLAQTLAARDDEVQQVPLFAALTESETLINRVAAEPLGTYAHPWPEAKSWPARATFRQAEEILRLSEGYRLYAAPEDTFLARCARRLEAYASDIDAQQNTVERVQAQQPDPANPFGAPLVNALAALPTWPLASSVIPRQATRS
ncbi:TPA: multidrug transporter subunit MdtO [Klebsiella michiganensis]|jgi:multidrug resistance protein MdtO|uniref:FUSC family protein n=1 Tax=Klebsiella TaxID=570 RepID=UPI0007CCFE70|nr:MULTISPECIES: FUSC family protein [Klebsiella]EKV5144474.1 FUSC family protein [Klebsiella michiganensis]ELR9566097.1 FUSC family protein [Klebsiella michiganensis]MBA4426207.1 multidrug transporter subunit MdtO [Klebsiella michiganensis]MBW5959763.1 multidrug transporter subunit MdtO [Klebsiella michiganensis]MBZ7624938.1 multidrug transporter subunit MdtO [Klebsiella michiganensis]